jgi:hypothetical protein
MSDDPALRAAQAQHVPSPACEGDLETVRLVARRSHSPSPSRPGKRGRQEQTAFAALTLHIISSVSR